MFCKKDRGASQLGSEPLQLELPEYGLFATCGDSDELSREEANLEQCVSPATNSAQDCVTKIQETHCLTIHPHDWVRHLTMRIQAVPMTV